MKCDKTICLNKEKTNDKKIMTKNCDEIDYSPINTLKLLLNKIENTDPSDLKEKEQEENLSLEARILAFEEKSKKSLEKICDDCFCPPLDLAYYEVLSDINNRLNETQNLLENPKPSTKEIKIDEKIIKEIDFKEIFEQILEIGKTKWSNNEIITNLQQIITNKTFSKLCEIFKRISGDKKLVLQTTAFLNKLNENPLSENPLPEKSSDNEKKNISTGEEKELEKLLNIMPAATKNINNIFRLLFEICKHFMNNELKDTHLKNELSDKFSEIHRELSSEHLNKYIEMSFNIIPTKKGGRGKRRYRLKTKKYNRKSLRKMKRSLKKNYKGGGIFGLLGGIIGATCIFIELTILWGISRAIVPLGIWLEFQEDASTVALYKNFGNMAKELISEGWNM